MSASGYSSSRLALAEASGSVSVVPMGGVAFVPFEKTPSIGTRDLAGCSVVIIASKYGAILAHIPPRPTKESSSGDKNVKRIMDLVAEEYKQQRNYFPSSDTYAIFAVFEGQIALQDQKNIIERRIDKMGLSPFNTILYIVPRDPTNPGQGTALVQYRSNAAQVYVEDRLVSNEQAQPQAQPQAQQQAQPSTSEWIWSEQYYRYYRYVNGEVEWASDTKTAM